MSTAPISVRAASEKPALSRARTILRNNGLTLVLLGMFALSWAGQLLAGHRTYNEERREHRLSEVGLLKYMTSGHFLEATAENWESEFLQMGVFVILTCCLFQKGSPESKDPDSSEPQDEDPARHSRDPRAPWPVRRGGWALRIYSHSLSIAFILLFATSFMLHAMAGQRAFNEEQVEHGALPVSVLGYMVSSEFWYQSFQNWQSEFLSIAAMVYLGVYLRQQGSPESKPVHAPHDENE